MRVYHALGARQVTHVIGGLFGATVPRATVQLDVIVAVQAAHLVEQLEIVLLGQLLDIVKVSIYFDEPIVRVWLVGGGGLRLPRLI